jgi:hypothetical protein
MRDSTVTKAIRNIKDNSEYTINPVIADLDNLSKAVTALNAALIGITVAQTVLDIIATLCSSLTLGATLSAGASILFAILTIGAAIADIVVTKKTIDDLQESVLDTQSESSSYITAYDKCGNLETDFNMTKDAFDTYAKDNLDFLNDHTNTFASKKTKMRDIMKIVKPILTNVKPIIEWTFSEYKKNSSDKQKQNIDIVKLIIDTAIYSDQTDYLFDFDKDSTQYPK